MQPRLIAPLSRSMHFGKFEMERMLYFRRTLDSNFRNSNIGTTCMRYFKSCSTTKITRSKIFGKNPPLTHPGKNRKPPINIWDYLQRWTEAHGYMRWLSEESGLGRDQTFFVGATLPKGYSRLNNHIPLNLISIFFPRTPFRTPSGNIISSQRLTHFSSF